MGVPRSSLEGHLCTPGMLSAKEHFPGPRTPSPRSPAPPPWEPGTPPRGARLPSPETHRGSVGSQLEFMGSLWTTLEHSTKGPGVFLKRMGGLRKHCKTIRFSYVFRIWRFLERSHRSGEETLEESLTVLRSPWGGLLGVPGRSSGHYGYALGNGPLSGTRSPPPGARHPSLGA